MSGVNKAIILGRLGKDVELAYTTGGQPVAKFSVATSETWNDKSGQKQERVQWHNIVVWGKLGELCKQYLSKGRECYIEGRIETRSYDDKNGEKRYITEINAQTVQFIGGQQRDDGDHDQRPRDSRGQSKDYQPEVDEKYADSEIPF